MTITLLKKSKYAIGDVPVLDLTPRSIAKNLENRLVARWLFDRILNSTASGLLKTKRAFLGNKTNFIRE